MLKYVICGTGHCGTGFFAELMTASGSPCGWESVFTYRYTPPPHEQEGESSAMALPYLDDHPIPFVIHLVRHPAYYIRSQLTRTNLFQFEEGKFLLTHCPVAAPYRDGISPTIEWAARFWLDWNRRISYFAHMRVRIEHIDHTTFKMRGREMPDTRGLRRHEKANPNDPLPDLEKVSVYEGVKKLAREYGYAV